MLTSVRVIGESRGSLDRGVVEEEKGVELALLGPGQHQQHAREHQRQKESVARSLSARGSESR